MRSANPDTKTPAIEGANANKDVRSYRNVFILGMSVIAGLLPGGAAAQAHDSEPAKYLRGVPVETLPTDRPVETCDPDERVLILRRYICESEEPTRSGPPIGPAGDEFYTAPEMPDQDGDIVWYRPTKFLPLLYQQSAAKAWQILYRSRAATGEPIAVSGTILTPPGETVPNRPIISYASGTQGMADRCAPSKVLRSGLHYEGLIIQQLLRRGWAVLLTDYQGLGTPGEHTYVVGQSLGRSVLDIVRAGSRLPEAGLSATAPVGIMGYSEGGSAAAWAAELQPSYAPELRVHRVAAGGIPADLIRVGKFVDRTNRGIFGGLLMFTAVGLNEAYSELNLDAHLSSKGMAMRDIVRASCLVDGLAKTAFVRARDSTTTDLFQEPSWAARFRENKLGSTKPGVPLYMWHSVLDEAVQFDQAKALRDTYCRAGAAVKWDAFILSEHLLGLYIASSRAIRFLADGFAGAPTPNNCHARYSWYR